MLVVVAVAAAAALIVLAYHRLRRVAPETGAAGLRAARDLADVVLLCVRAVEGIVGVLARNGRLTAATPNRWGYEPEPTGYDPEDVGYEPGDDDEFEEDRR